MTSPAVHLVRRFGAGELFAPPHATVRSLAVLPDGRLAAGSDYGLAIRFGSGFAPFAFPRGSRREARHVEAMAALPHRLVVATSRSWFEWDYVDQIDARALPRDDVGGHDDVRAMLAVGDRLIVGWRTHLQGGTGPAEALSLAIGPHGDVLAGTLDGALHAVDGGVVARFGGPVRHIAATHDAIWVAAGGALHRSDGGGWRRREGEPTSLLADGGRLWTVRDGVLALGEGDWPEPVDLLLHRPWCLGASPEGLWIGEVGGLVLAEVAG